MQFLDLGPKKTLYHRIRPLMAGTSMHCPRCGESKKVSTKLLAPNRLRVYGLECGHSRPKALLAPTFEEAEPRTGLLEFARKYNLKVSVDRSDGALVIRGRFGQFYEYGDGKLAMLYSPDLGTPKKWEKARWCCEAVGMETLLDGEAEGACEFDPRDNRQADMARAIVGCEVGGSMGTIYPEGLEEMPLAA